MSSRKAIARPNRNSKRLRTYRCSRNPFLAICDELKTDGHPLWAMWRFDIAYTESGEGGDLCRTGA